MSDISMYVCIFILVFFSEINAYKAKYFNFLMYSLYIAHFYNISKLIEGIVHTHIKHVMYIEIHIYQECTLQNYK